MKRPVIFPRFLLVLAILTVLIFTGCRKDVVVQEIVPQQVKIFPKKDIRDSTVFNSLNNYPEIWMLELYLHCYTKYIPDINLTSSSHISEIEKRSYVKGIITSSVVFDATGQRYQFSINLGNMQYNSNQQDWVALIDSLGFELNYAQADTPFVIAYIPAGKELEMSDQFRKLSWVQSANPILYPVTIKENESFYNFIINRF